MPVSPPPPVRAYSGEHVPYCRYSTTNKESSPKGRHRDYPLFPNRGFMLDVARKFFTMDYLKQYVKILSFYKMNEFQIHLNDNGFPQFFGDDWNRTYAAFRLESERFPGTDSQRRFIQQTGIYRLATYGIGIRCAYHSRN